MSYVAQVRDAYVDGTIEIDELEEDIELALALETDPLDIDGLPVRIPGYLRDQHGRSLFELRRQRELNLEACRRHGHHWIEVTALGDTMTRLLCGCCGVQRRQPVSGPVE